MIWVVLLAWGYVVVLMALTAAWSPDGGLWAALRVLVGYGLLPMALFVYIAGSPLRRRAARRAAQTSASDAPDTGGHASAGAENSSIAPVREKH